MRDLVERARADSRVLALWLQGSFATGRADRYSDVDAHLLTGHDDDDAFRSEAQIWLDSVRPMVHCTSMFDGRMLHGVTDEGMRVDLWMHAGETHEAAGSAVKILLDPAGRVSARAAAPARADAGGLARHLNEFWRIFAMLPVVIGRDERVKGVVGSALAADALAEALVYGGSGSRNAGVKRLNEFIPDTWREELEEALLDAGSARVDIANTQLRLAALMQQHGRAVAARHAVEYPEAFEAAAVRYVRADLERLDVSVDRGLLDRLAPRDH